MPQYQVYPNVPTNGKLYDYTNEETKCNDTSARLLCTPAMSSVRTWLSFVRL